MSDRPDFDPEKNFETIRKNWDKKPTYFVSELEALDQKIETNLEQIREQLSALFQLAQKSLGDQIDGAIDRDFKNSKLEELFFAIIKLEERIGKLEERVELLKTELNAEGIDLTKLATAIFKNDAEIWEEIDGVLGRDIERLFEEIRKLKTK